MNENEFRQVYPRIIEWIRQALAQHAPAARSVASFGFSRLPQYYSQDILSETKVVVVPMLPFPPLASMGITQFTGFDPMDPNNEGVAYLDTYFVRADLAHTERLHFHELVHIVQWRMLGPEQFLADCAHGLKHFGYPNYPLETMAYGLQKRFECETQPFSVEAECQSLILRDK